MIISIKSRERRKNEIINLKRSAMDQFFEFNPSKQELLIERTLKIKDQLKTKNFSVDELKKQVDLAKTHNKNHLTHIIDQNFEHSQGYSTDAQFDNFKYFIPDKTKLFSQHVPASTNQVEVVKVADERIVEQFNEIKQTQTMRQKLYDVIKNQPKVLITQFYRIFSNDSRELEGRRNNDNDQYVQQVLEMKKHSLKKATIAGLQISDLMKYDDRINQKYKVATSVKLNKLPKALTSRKTPNLMDQSVNLRDGESHEDRLRDTYYKRRIKLRQKFSNNQF